MATGSMQRVEPRETTATKSGLLAFTLLAYGITWVLMIAAHQGLEAGVLDEEDALVGLLVQVAASAPLIAALIVSGVSAGKAGVIELGRALGRWRVSPAWYAFVFAGVPALMLTTMSFVHGAELLRGLAEGWPVFFTQFPLLVLGVALFTGLAEEPGWRGYALPWANRRFAPFPAALLVSIIWALWHLPNALFSSEGPGAMIAHVAATVVNGLVQAWVFNSTRGSVFVAMLLHGSMNATAGVILQLLEGMGSPLSPTRYYAVSAMTFGVLIIVVAVATRGQLGAER